MLALSSTERRRRRMLCLSGKTARCGLITTKGFRDVLELGRRTRPQAYGMIASFEPLIPRELRLEVAERMDAAGRVLVPLDRGSDAPPRCSACATWTSRPSSSISSIPTSIPPMRKRAAAIVAEMWPEAFVTAGHRTTSEFREYERGVTASINASVQPVLQRYLSRLQAGLAERGYQRDFLVMQGNGGTVASRNATKAAVQTVMSGPASGVIAAAFTANGRGLCQRHHLRHGRNVDRRGADRGGPPARLARARA